MSKETGLIVSSEDYLVGCLLKDYPFVFNLCDTLGFSVDYLESPTVKSIWTGAEILFGRGISVDIASVVDHLEVSVKHIDIAGASSFMMKSMTIAINMHSLTHHISVIKARYRRRNAIGILTEGIDRLSDKQDVEDVSSWTQHSLVKMSKDLDHFSESPKDKRERIRERYKNVRNRGTTGIESRYSELQQHLASYQSGKITIIAARPKVGKSTLALNEVMFTAMVKKIPSAMFSIEMDYDELIEKAASDLTEMDNKKLKLGEYSDTHIETFMTKGVDEVMKAPLHVIDDPSITVERICSKTRELVAEFGVKLVAIDYLQIISSTPGSRFQSRTYEIGHMTNELRKLAKETGVAIILLSQISRPPKGGDYADPKTLMPTMNDLRDSGSIEQDAYAIVIIGPSQIEGSSPSWMNIDPCCIRVEANRGGSTGDFECMFNKPNNKFMNQAEYEKYRHNYFKTTPASNKPK